jgi:tetratricopeptide (TPR) repeat protein
MDQAHFYFSSDLTSVAALQKAATWNPDDSAVQVRLAHAEKSAGDTQAAVASLARAAAVNPANLSIQESYARALIETGRDAEAAAQFRQILSRQPRNADAWLDLGLLEHRLGHDEESVDALQRAVDADPTQAHAQLYLAQAFEQRGELQAATRHYRAFLQIDAAAPKEHEQDASVVLNVLVKVADADSAAGRMDDAMKGYQAAVSYSEKSGNRATQSLALAHLADLQERLGDSAGAAKSHQSALALDAGLRDAKSAAIDWFNYGQFLLRTHQEEKLAFACFLHAQDLLRGTSVEEVQPVTHAREMSESRLGRQAAEARKEAAQLVEKALTLPSSTFSSSH